MKTVILCGGLGTRLAEETQIKPKPMVGIGGRPILWHIMNIYARHRMNDFVLALGYKGDHIKNYFLNYHPLMSDLTVHLKTGVVDYSNPTAEDWHVSMIDTGTSTLTGGRLLRLKRVLQPTGTFMLTYGDGVADVDVTAPEISSIPRAARNGNGCAAFRSFRRNAHWRWVGHSGFYLH